MFKNILVPIDGSKTSLMAVDKAICMAKAFDSKVCAVYVIDPYPFSGIGADFAYGQTQYLDAAKSEAESVTKQVEDKLSAANISVCTKISESHAAWRGILEAADEMKADLIVMGSHGRRGIEKFILGSVAQRVLSNATLPVLVIRDKNHEE